MGIGAADGVGMGGVSPPIREKKSNFGTLNVQFPRLKYIFANETLGYLRYADL